MIIHGVFNDSPAETGGLFPGDIVIEINGERVVDYRQLSRIVGSLVAGQEAHFLGFRAGKEISLDIVIDSRGSEAEIEKAYNEMWPGFSVIHTDAVTTESRETLIEGIMILDLPPLGMPRAAGMKTGDIIVSINSIPVKNLVDFYRVLNDTETKAFDFLLNRTGEEITIGIIRR